MGFQMFRVKTEIAAWVSGLFGCLRDLFGLQGNIFLCLLGAVGPDQQLGFSVFRANDSQNVL